MTSSEMRWLDHDEQEAWVPLIAVLFRLAPTLDAQLQADAGVTFYEYCVLAGLSEIGRDGIRVTELAAITSGAPSRLSQVLGRMERRRWLERRPDPDDGRATRVHLLPAGRELLETAAPGHVSAVRQHVFDQLTPTQVRHLRSIALRIAATLVPADSLIFARDTLVGAENGEPD